MSLEVVFTLYVYGETNTTNSNGEDSEEFTTKQKEKKKSETISFVLTKSPQRFLWEKTFWSDHLKFVTCFIEKTAPAGAEPSSSRKL